jgi:hypothetical protein
MLLKVLMVIKIKDGSYQVFVVDKKGVLTNVKHMKVYETKKKGIGLKPFKEKETGKEGNVTTT